MIRGTLLLFRNVPRIPVDSTELIQSLLKPKAAPVCKESKDSEQLKAVLAADLERERARSAELEKDKKEAEARLAAAEKTLAEIKVVGTQVVDYTVALKAEYDKTVANYNALSDKYNNVVMQANNSIVEANNRLARQQRIANAFALYNAMPRYNPPQTINLNVADCTKLPALCVH
jgi:hypothetical protein